MSRIIFPANQRIFKNRIINGDFSVWQRGTTATYISDSVNLTVDGGYKTADRIFCANACAGGQFTVSKSTMNGFNSFKVTVDVPPDNLTWDGTNGRQWAPFVYRFEGQHLYDLAIQKKSVTISFLFRSNVAGRFYIAFRKTNPTDSYLIPFDYNGNGSAVKVATTIPLDYNWSTPPQNDNLLGWEIILCAIGDHYSGDTTNTWITGDFHQGSDYTNWASTAGNYIEIAQLQLEEGETATDFEYVPYDIQLMRCMRYYEKGVILAHFGEYNNLYGEFYYKVKKRANPSIKLYNPVTGDTNVFATGAVGGSFAAEVSCVNTYASDTDGGSNYWDKTLALNVIAAKVSPPSADDAHGYIAFEADSEL